jgi:hypothetical protein
MSKAALLNNASKRVRVNIMSLANTAEIRKEKRNGRDVIIVPSATLPDDVVMNDILYPADEIGKSYDSLNRTPAPYGHPMVGNRFVSASDPEGINIGYIGAWNENARRENGRVFLDKIIDVEFANRSEEGKAVLNAIEAGDPIHTSTGLLCNLDAAEEGAGHSYIARNMEFDHDAILLNEEGAATPEQGVGMLVNGQEIEVVNSVIDDADRELDWAAQSALRALKQREDAPLLERIKSALIEAFSGSEREPSANRKEADMAVSDEQFKALSAKVDTLSDGFDKMGETISNAVAGAVKPLTDNLEALQANQAAKEQEELDGLIEKIVKANILDEAAAKELTLNAARALAEKAKPGQAAALNSGETPNSTEDEWKDYDLNAALNEESN